MAAVRVTVRVWYDGGVTHGDQLSHGFESPSNSLVLLTGDGEWPELRLFHHSCALKKDEGPCKALVERFYFDVETGGCERFDYGGCQGNANNFESLQKCEDMCLVRQDKSPCHLEEETGPCRGMVLRYFYSMASRRCERFFYGGCFGNANNFRTEEACRARCHGNSKCPASDPILLYWREPHVDHSGICDRDRSVLNGAGSNTHFIRTQCITEPKHTHVHGP
ncbi:hypothetical protein Z043_120975 [Scleropages formosus]|uniref:BPTI/Kunitz inhibitor domain-containing protein n=1 Tax=Scleropages formosus TaxID=113540 RepID=A0A0P7UID3_SCLFO|nr:hypothetical protein Z043_120975 [Scleropages formosus]